MMNTSEKSSGPFGEWATQLKGKFKRDEFFIARLKLTALYFVVGAFIFLAVGSLTDATLKNSFNDLTGGQNSQVAQEAFTDLQAQLWIRRVFQLFLFVGLAYVLATFTMRPLKRSAELQKRFVATASHQFKTPLAVMKTSIEVVLRKKDSVDHERLIQTLQDSLGEVNRLSSVVQFLMAFSDFHSHTSGMVMELVDLDAVITKAVGKCHILADKRNITINVNGSAGSIHGNAVALEEVFANLLGNALQYTPAGGNISVMAAAQDGVTMVKVSDTGTGIAGSDLQHIFEPFYRGKGSRAHENEDGNMGLGLNIVREIVQLHKGVISVESSPNGTEFKIVLPQA